LPLGLGTTKGVYLPLPDISRQLKKKILVFGLAHILANVRLAFRNIHTDHVETNDFEASHAKMDSFSLPFYLFTLSPNYSVLVLVTQQAHF
jgi:hypothetical protein